MPGRVFLGWTSTKQGLMCLAFKGHNPVTLMRFEPTTPRSQDKHSTTESLYSLCYLPFQVPSIDYAISNGKWFNKIHDSLNIKILLLTIKHKYGPAHEILVLINYFISVFIQASLSKIQGLLKDFSRLSYTFQGQKVYEKPWFKCNFYFRNARLR